VGCRIHEHGFNGFAVVATVDKMLSKAGSGQNVVTTVAVLDPVASEVAIDNAFQDASRVGSMWWDVKKKRFIGFW
jgi:hypothetical protein